MIKSSATATIRTITTRRRYSTRLDLSLLAKLRSAAMHGHCADGAELRLRTVTNVAPKISNHDDGIRHPSHFGYRDGRRNFCFPIGNLLPHFFRTPHAQYHRRLTTPRPTTDVHKYIRNTQDRNNDRDDKDLIKSILLDITTTY
jgi:hypothetical protein